MNTKGIFISYKTLAWACFSAIGIAMIAFFFMGSSGEIKEKSPNTLTLAADAKTPSQYICPMICTPPLDHPGKCPVCGMELKPLNMKTPEPSVSDADDDFFDDMDESEKKSAEEELEKMPVVHLTPEAVRIAEIQTAKVERRNVQADIRLFGRIDYDPAHKTAITAFMPGVIDRVYVKRAGQFVRWGDPLFDIYSSDLLQTQRQLIEAMKYVPSFLAFQGNMPHVARDMPVQSRSRGGHEASLSEESQEALKTIQAIRHKLSILGMPKRDIDQMMKKGEATGIATVYASMYGQVSVHNAFEGSYVNTGAPIFTLADPKYMWLRLDAYERDYSWLRINQAVTFETDVYPGEIFTGRVVYIDPVFNPETRTFSIGAITTGDKGGRFKAGMLVRAVIKAGLTEDGKVAGGRDEKKKGPLVIPYSAPLMTGTRAVVYVRLPGRDAAFEGREVRLGPKAGDYYVVSAGLKEGEEVVVNGNFKIDSTAQIYAKSGMMAWAGSQQAGIHQNHGGSSQMSDAYMKIRRKSRFHEESEVEGSRKARRNTASPGSRRRPGQYGDTTRPGQD